MQTGDKPLVKTAANITKSVIYNNREQFSAGIIVAGHDNKLGGQVQLISVFSKEQI
jgi:20S proteasome alpha/beta subunit